MIQLSAGLIVMLTITAAMGYITLSDAIADHDHRAQEQARQRARARRERQRAEQHAQNTTNRR